MISIPSNFVDEMIEHSIQEDPNECCGILVGSDNVISALHRVTNIRPSPYIYVMDPKETLKVINNAEDLGLEAIAFYHSHTHTPAFPSDTDRRLAVESGWTGDLICYVLISLEKDEPEVKCYRVDDETEVSEEQFEIIPATS